MRRLSFDVPAYLAAYRAAMATGKNHKELAAMLGVTLNIVRHRNWVLRRRGIDLPGFKRGRPQKIRSIAAKVERKIGDDLMFDTAYLRRKPSAQWVPTPPPAELSFVIDVRCA